MTAKVINIKEGRTRKQTKCAKVGHDLPEAWDPDGTKTCPKCGLTIRAPWASA